MTYKHLDSSRNMKVLAKYVVDNLLMCGIRINTHTHSHRLSSNLTSRVNLFISSETAKWCKNRFAGFVVCVRRCKHLSKNYALNDLACQECELTKLDLKNNTSLHVVTCYKNNISGANMTALLTSLHSGIGGSIVLKSTSTDANKALVSDVAIATAKKWKVFYSDYTEYSGE